METGRAGASCIRLPLHVTSCVIIPFIIKAQNNHSTYRARSTVEARDDGAIILDEFAVRSRVLWRAGASVRSLTGVEASASVLARLVVGAIVEVLVAKETAPSFVAIARVGRLASAVQTARIADALVTQFTLPSRFAPVRQRRRKKTNKQCKQNLFSSKS